MDSIEFGKRQHRAAGDFTSNFLDDAMREAMATDAPANVMDSEEARAELSKLLEWFYFERDKQATNRLQMALDSNFYDGEQWSQDDALEVESRGQMPLVYNEIAPMVDWVIGTERRTKVDWSVLPRTEDDVQAADVKTKVLKFVADNNKVSFARSRAFADAVKVGVGWLDDGARDDPQQDVLYSKYEDWRNVLWDSNSYELDLSDARYIFRWRWVDVDIALAMFPDRHERILAAARDQNLLIAENDEALFGHEQTDTITSTTRGSSGILADAKRQRVKIIEAQYRKPVLTNYITEGAFKGAALHESDGALQRAALACDAAIEQKISMRVHIALFLETDMLHYGVSPYRHNQFTLTPIFCYRRGRDRLPYGVVRRVRDIQQDLNKRASKALFMLNTNQIIMDDGATDDLERLREEADRPDGVLIKKSGKQFELRRDTDGATGQINMMTLAAQSIQKTAGVNNENLGRQTNAVSGAAIEARQNQGAVGTTEPFDNARLAVQVQGQKMLSLCEQYYSEEKVIRITGAKGRVDWLRVNQPEQQPDGSIRLLNDITNSQADFIVSEADYAGTLRQMMFDSINQLVQKLPPEVGLRLFTIAMEFSDLPNKDEIVETIRRMTGDPDPNKEPTPEEQQAMQQQQQVQAEAMQMQREQAMLALEEQRAKIAKLQAEAKAIGDNKTQSDGADHLDHVSEQLQKLELELANRAALIDKDKAIAHLNADVKLRIAEIQHASNERIALLQRQLAAMQDNDRDGDKGFDTDKDGD